MTTGRNGTVRERKVYAERKKERKMGKRLVPVWHHIIICPWGKHVAAWGDGVF